MVKQQYILSIPTPCDENWDKMTPTEKGRFCNFCEKTIIDFSSFSDKKLLKHIQESNEVLCGRISSGQLNRSITSTTENSPLFARAAAILALLGGTFTALGQDQLIPQETFPSGQIMNDKNSHKTSDSITLQSVEIRGRIIDDLGDPLPFANIQVLEYDSFGTHSDFDGNFKLNLQNPDTLIHLKINYVGTVEIIKPIRVTNKLIELGDITLHESEKVLMGEVVIIKPTAKMKRKRKKENRKKKNN